MLLETQNWLTYVGLLNYDNLKFELRSFPRLPAAAKLRLVAVAGQSVKENKRNLLMKGP